MIYCNLFKKTRDFQIFKELKSTWGFMYICTFNNNFGCIVHNK